MSGKKNGSRPADSRSGAGNKKPDLFSIETILDDIETEEKKVIESFPEIADSFDGDLDDILEDIDDIEDPDELDDLDDLDDADDLGDADDLDDYSGAGFWDDDDQSGKSSAGVMDSIRSALHGGKDGKGNLMPLLIIALLAVIIIILLMQNCGSCKDSSNDDWFDTSAVEGTLPGKSPEEIQSMLNQIVEEGMFNVSIAPAILFESPQAQGQARIENIPANHYHMSVKITLDETSETIYESKGIRPGQYIEYITLQKELQPGEYAATATFSAYDADDLSEQGRVAVKITIIVE